MFFKNNITYMYMYAMCIPLRLKNFNQFVNERLMFFLMKFNTHYHTYYLTIELTWHTHILHNYIHNNYIILSC